MSKCAQKGSSGERLVAAMLLPANDTNLSVCFLCFVLVVYAGTTITLWRSPIQNTKRILESRTEQ